MIQSPIDVLQQYPIRKSRKQKKAFRADVCAYLHGLGYETAEEKGSLGTRNVVIGDPKTAKYLITAHYDTCAHMPVPNFITPCNFWIYLLYQLLVTGVILIAAGAVGYLANLIVRDSMISLWIGYMAMLGFLYLMMLGPANKHNANDNTSGVVSVLQMAQSLPQVLREDVCFVLFDLEEAGLIGSASYYSAHKTQAKQQLVLNLDCVGDGDEIVFFPSGKLKKQKAWMDRLNGLDQVRENKKIRVLKKGFSMYPSDQANFPLGIGVAALHRGKHIGLYMDRIHTNRDTVLEADNVEFLADTLIQWLQGQKTQ